jgi:hypothetical protein
MAANWVPALLGGVELTGAVGILRSRDVTCAFYGDLFRRAGRNLGSGELMSEGSEIAYDDVEGAELLAAWWAAAAEVDPGVAPPGARTLAAVTGIQAALGALASSQFLSGATERFLIYWLKQVRGYFTNIELRAEIQARFTRTVTAETQVIVAHSLGSVVAYEALCAHPEWQVRSLVTLGSPLGIRNVIFDRLNPAPQRLCGSWQVPWPSPLTSWTNIADRGDFVALVKRLKPLFGDRVEDVEISNGVRAHDVTRYLTATATGAAIIRGLSRDPGAQTD